VTHVILTGFMAVGKTAVGRRLARRLGWRFIDTDALIEEREGMSIADIFESRGEEYFRRAEREVIDALDPPEPAVIATGGGTFVDAHNRSRLERLGVTVCLVTSLETVMKRVARNGKRPLARGDEARPRLEKLLEERMPVYRRADVLIETDALSVEQSAQRVLSMIEPRLRAGEEAQS
jgi:shikimate kinase